MMIPRLPLSLCLGAVLSVSAWGAAEAKQIDVAEGESVQAAIDRAMPGDVVRLAAGRHEGSIIIDRAIELTGEPGAVLDGLGTGNAITVNAPGTLVRGLEVHGSGENVPELNAGIFVSRTATGTRVENNRLIDNLYGIYLHGAADSIATGNEVIGRRNVRMTQTGSGISIWNAPGAKVIGNIIRYGRDGIYTNASRKNVFRDNLMENVRFAVHYMYTNSSEVTGNISRNNSVGFAIMYTNRLKVTDNLSEGDRDHGLLLNYANSSVVSGNRVIGRMQSIDRWLDAGLQKGEHGLPAEDESAAATGETMRLGPEKCVFIYNANKNKFTDNSFENCSIGIHFTAGSEGNAMSGNAFINNRNQVKYVGTRDLDWSVEGRGNYWSDNPAFDLNGDGIADNPYRPNDLIDKVLWTAPQAKILINSPAVETIRWAQTQFPALLPGGVVDSHPLMKPPLAEIKSND
ncbi:nitrous oxide reductase family maturation protein NosD [Falsochrobactrum shanghaiense]|uniref:Nitrous oxide reductase family maturation protein NosD n=1 Tax=Falsochrobactrum shanghaiense TaxID=2201899 RepID=A0A316J8F2_9HYPH|nr:nitrous oxide reductase family maturation protein NosD [Falsochrobactrum shanghaiense]PWL17448.1 nitrous oxide reductase family maturation protein NosD [Falsochrobactrum shanghaiense]